MLFLKSRMNERAGARNLNLHASKEKEISIFTIHHSEFSCAGVSNDSQIAKKCILHMALHLHVTELKRKIFSLSPFEH